MLEAYFDESSRDGGTFCVAGYVFSKRQAKKFKKEWSDLFAGFKGGCHMVDLVALSEAFEGISGTERDRLVREAVRIIKNRISYGVAVSCNVNEILKLSPRWIRGMGHAYPICCHLSMTAVGHLLEKNGVTDSVSYIFEAGHEYEAEARDFIKGAVAVPVCKSSYRHHADAFIPKADAIPLQAADVFAWEWAKCYHESLEKDIRPVRRSLRALFSGRAPHYSVNHITGPKLAKYMNECRELGLLQLREEGILKNNEEPRVPKIRSRYARTGKGSAQRDQSQTGRGKGSEEAES